MSIYKRGGTYWFSFTYNGERIQKSTQQKNKNAAIDIEAAHRTALAKGDVGIVERKPAPTLKHFLEKDFLTYVDSKHAEKPNTKRYYHTGVKSLVDSDLAQLKLDEVNDQHAQQFAARHSRLSPSTINCGLRTLRRAIYLAAEWGTIDRRPKIRLARGERQRDRVLQDTEINVYLSACEQPWRDCAVVMLGTGMRPGEVFALRWERVGLGDGKGMLQISDGKSKAAKRMLPLVSPVLLALQNRWISQSKPAAGWVFPADSQSGHLEGGSAKNYHVRALSAIEKTAKRKGEKSPVKKFPPYTMRHTALTRLAEAGCDPFTLARIAGHSSITITQRYTHPQKEAVESAFAKLDATSLLQFSLHSESVPPEAASASASKLLN